MKSCRIAIRTTLYADSLYYTTEPIIGCQTFVCQRPTERNRGRNDGSGQSKTIDVRRNVFTPIGRKPENRCWTGPSSGARRVHETRAADCVQLVGPRTRLKKTTVESLRVGDRY